MLVDFAACVEHSIGNVDWTYLLRKVFEVGLDWSMLELLCKRQHVMPGKRDPNMRRFAFHKGSRQIITRYSKVPMCDLCRMRGSR